MKICILGPVITKNYYGGVAIFDEGLAKGFLDNGCSVFLATDQKRELVTDQKTIPLRIIGKKSLKKILAQEKPDFIIASLGYAKHLIWTRTSAYKIYFLHGFFKKSHYGSLKTLLAVIYQKFLIRRCDAVFANSFFTEVINRDLYGINADAVFHLGVTDRFYNIATRDCPKDKKVRSILFVGKLTKTKGIYKLIQAARRLSEKNVPYKLCIAGDGPEKVHIEKQVYEYNLAVEFLDRLDQEELVRFYQESEIFVTLDPSEPFGIVFLEALLCGCKIVCPLTGGQVEYLSKFSESVAFVNSQSYDSIADGIEKMFAIGKPPVLSMEERESMTYKSVAGKMLEYIRRKRHEKSAFTGPSF